MFLTVSKRLEFSASRRLSVPGWSDAQNHAAFGSETTARYGTGRNYVVWFVFTGAVDKSTGMLMNISEIKRRAGALIDDSYDHRFLNEDNANFADLVPTAENIARQLVLDVAPLFNDSGAELTAVHLIESRERSATAFADGSLEANFNFEFSAARRTMSPHLSDAENTEVFGSAAFPHGHHYRSRLTVRGADPLSHYASLQAMRSDLSAELDHRYLNEVEALRELPMTTEMLARYVYDRAAAAAPLDRARLHERDDFFAEYRGARGHLLGMQHAFSAAHRLQSYEISEEQSAAMYGKCNNPRGHGHVYIAEATVGGALDERTGTLFGFTELQRALADAIAPWQNRHLDLETKEFAKTPSTGENIVQALWPKVSTRVRDRLHRLRLWETLNNRFTLRRAA